MIYIWFIVRAIHVIIIVYTVVYFIGILFFDMASALFNGYDCSEEDRKTDSCQEFFHGELDMSLIDHDHSRVVIIGMYFIFTSLSTVGFGDYYPYSDVERAVTSMILLLGVIVFA